MNSLEIKKKFLDFLKSKQHSVIPNASLIPVNDPSILFTTAGMHPLTINLMGQPHSAGKRLTNIQRCLRTGDIEEVGNTIHLTMFEMLGYWSLGDYFKKEAIDITFEFYTSEKYMNLAPERLYVTVFEGDDDSPEDIESIRKWQEVFKSKGIEAKVWNKKDFESDNLRIFPLNKKENWWGPAGETGPCGPDSEMFYWRGEGKPDFKKFVPWDESNMFIEISNDVFMAFNKNKEGKYQPLEKKNVDFGGGLERLAMIQQFRNSKGEVPFNISLFNTDLFDTTLTFIRSMIEDETKRSVINTKADEVSEFKPELTTLTDPAKAVISIRIILDHLRACTFLVGDGIEPSNKDQGYILRRLIRRSIRHAKLLGIDQVFLKDMTILNIDKYKVQYPQLEESRNKIINTMEKEEIMFECAIENGSKELSKMIARGKDISGKDLFYLYETHGYPIEMSLDQLEIKDESERQKFLKEHDIEKEKHQKMSRKGSEQKFKGGLANHSEKTTAYHTTTHILLKALQTVLGDHVHQRGSNITEERLRFDFSHTEKVAPEKLEEVEKIVNEIIMKELTVQKKKMSKEEAMNIGAEHEFNRTYPEAVFVYFIEDEKNKVIFSTELCGGPHIDNTSELKQLGTFKIIKEESSGSGIRRIKAVIE